TEVSSSVIKAFLKEEKPLVKSKLKKVIEMLEHEGTKLPEEMLSLLIEMFHIDEGRGSFSKKSFVKIFQYPLETLSAEILDSVKRLNKMGIAEEALFGINKALLLEAESFSALELKEKSQGRILDALDEFNKSGSFSDKVKQEISGLKETLIRFNMLRACYIKTGIYPGFILIKRDDEIEMAEYRFDAESDGKGQKSYRIKLDMNPDLLGKVAIKGFLSGQNMSASFGASEEAVKDLEKEKESLLMALGRLNLVPRLSFGNHAQADEASGVNVRQINVRV
ncbi:MAG: flagellar hook-length control protein FliK, partial [Bacteroidota bacterium]